MIKKEIFEKAVMNGYYQEIKKIIEALEADSKIIINGNSVSEESRLLIMQLLSDFMKQEGKT